MLSVPDPIDAQDEGLLEAFVRSGRGVYLTGERPCCQDLDNSDQAIVQNLTHESGVAVGDGEDLDAGSLFQNQVNANAVGGITEVPNQVTTWVPGQPGVITGLDAANIVTEGYQNNVLVATGGAWSASDITGHRGALVLLMDINWLESGEGDLADAAPFVTDIAHFLSSSVTGQSLPAGTRLCALGDSYSSGQGNPPFFDNGDPQSCNRSESGAYPDIIAERISACLPAAARSTSRLATAPPLATSGPEVPMRLTRISGPMRRPASPPARRVLEPTPVSSHSRSAATTSAFRT